MRVAPTQSITVALRVRGITGQLVDADSLPTVLLLQNGVDSAIPVTVNSTGSPGKYSVNWTGSGLAAGDQLQLEATATVDGTDYTAIIWEATVDEPAATSVEVTAARDTIIAQGNSAWITATGFATTAQLSSYSDYVIAQVTAYGDTAWTTVGPATVASAVRSELAVELGRLDIAVSTRLAANATPANFAALGITPAGHLERVSLVDVTTANGDMRGTDGAAVAGDAMTLTPAERGDVATIVEAALLNEGDGQALIAAIIARIESDLDPSDLSVSAIAGAVREAILDRVLTGNHDVAGSLGALIPALATELTTVIKSGEERTLSRAGKAPVTFTETRN